VTDSEHVYTATLQGSPDVPLDLHEDAGIITLNAGESPHVQASIRLTGATLELLDALDSRQSPIPRITIDVDATFPTATQEREFDLCVRGWRRDQETGEPVLALASDEALLEDFAPLADDETPFTLASSLRDVIDYVLDAAIPGTALEASPSVDADVTPYWSVTNLVTNPSVRGIVGNWIAGGSNGALTRQTGLTGSPVSGVTTYTRTTWSGNSGDGQGGAFSQSGTVAPQITAQPFKTYAISCWVRANVAKAVRLSVQIFAADGSVLNTGANVATATLVANTWTRLRGTITMPANAARIGVFSYVQAGSQWASGNTFDTLGWLVHEGTLDVPSFDAATTDSNYIYAASGEAHVSASTRTPYPIERDPESLIWKAGQKAIDFITPLVQTAGYRLVCDEHRQWTLRDATYRAAGSMTIRYGVNMYSGSDAISRDDDVWCDACVVIYTWDNSDGVSQTRIDSYALSGTPTYVRRIELRGTPYPGPGFAQYVVERAQGRGRQVSATTVANWDAAAEQPLTIRLSEADPQTGTAQSVQYDLSADEMTVTARTTDTPEDAWLFIPDDESWLDQPIGDDWTEETI
jgi:hypothetical protein